MQQNPFLPLRVLFTSIWIDISTIYEMVKIKGRQASNILPFDRFSALLKDPFVLPLTRKNNIADCDHCYRASLSSLLMGCLREMHCLHVYGNSTIAFGAHVRKTPSVSKTARPWWRSNAWLQQISLCAFNAFLNHDAQTTLISSTPNPISAA